MKGVQLPINVLIIIAIGIIVLIAMIAMFYNPFSSGKDTVSLDMAKSQACRSLVIGFGCDTEKDLTEIMVDNFDVDGINGLNTRDDNLMNLCFIHYQITTGSNDEISAACRKLCGCSA